VILGTPGAGLPGLGAAPLLALLAVAAVARGALVARQQAQAGALGERTAARIRDQLWAHLQQLPLDYVRRRGAGRLSLRFVADTRMVQRLVAQGLIQLAQDLLLLLAILLVLALLSWRMALCVALIVPAYGLLFQRLNPPLRKASRSTRRSRSRLAAYLHDRLQGLAVIKASVRQPVEALRMGRLTRRLARHGSRRASQGGLLQGLAAGTVALSGVVVLAVAALEIQAGRITGGTLVMFYTLLGLVVPIFQRIAVANRIFQEAYISLDRLRQTLSARPERPPVDTRPALQVSAGTLELRELGYAHPDRGVVLDGVSLQARRGELIAIAGPNGAGKSTLIELLMGFRPASSGRILIDGQRTSKVALDSLRAAIGFVPQDAPLLDGSVAENILYGVRSGVPEEALARAAGLTGVDALVARLPDGWDTQVGSGGGKLSGGQRQLVALARALAGDPPILILDEASAALDAAAEAELAQVLRRLAHDKTVIASAHRPATLMAADRIYVLERGRLVEQGTHAELLAAGGVYTRLFQAERQPA
jgi:ABC-type multidrug transport system fused ATPase/permease subunit